ncbi:hypothetical protein EDB85DRAFT_2162774 [Lactarius pseudohatsudake]|nr:hypothetical protein EDB85DRAFT_2162774 [Lactarius pseudohatsudake]
MEHDLNAYRSGLLQSKLYVGSPGFLPAVCWEQGKNGNVLSDKASKTDAVMSIYGSLEGAKFQLQLVKPVGTPFEKDFEKAFDVLTKVQGQAASTQDRRNFIVTEAGNKNFRFGEHVFEKRATPLDLDGGEVVDETTENWPILDDFHADLEKIKIDYRAVPLSVFKGDAFVPPEQVTDIVKGALVEVHFELYHYHIRNKGYDSFNSSIEQIIVLQPGEIQHIPVRSNKEFNPSQVLHVRSGLPGISENEEPLKEAHGNDVETVEGEAVKGKGKEVSK